MKKDKKRKKPLSKKEKKKIRRTNLLIKMYETEMKKGLDKSRFKLKKFPLLDNDLKRRLSNSYVIDQNSFDLYELEDYLILDNEVSSLVIKKGEEISLLFRNGYPVRIYLYDEELLPFNELKDFLEELINIIKLNPEINLSLHNGGELSK